jgi:predicted phage terminase large subunit-like protein
VVARGGDLTPQRRAAPRTPSIDDAQRKLLRKRARDELAILSLADFVRQAWKILEPAVPLSWNWHLDVICAELERVNSEYAAGRAVELVLCIPPGYAKSLIVSVFWPAWTWLRNPERRTLCFANADDLVKRDSRRTRDLIVSPWYESLKAHASRVFNVRGAWGKDGKQADTWGFKADQNEVINFANDVGGFRQCLAIHAAVTGKRADGHIIDDPYDAKEVILGSVAQMARRMKEVVDIYQAALETRINDRRRGFRVLIMQRLHPSDLAGVLIEEGVRCVVLPTEYDPASPQRHPLDPRGGKWPKAPAAPPPNASEGTSPVEVVEPANSPAPEWEGPQADYERTFGRTYRGPVGEGALLFPKLFTPEVVARTKRRLGPRHYSAQEQQRPILTTGTIFRKATFRRYNHDPQRFQCDEYAISVDCAFRKHDDTDFVVFQVWGRRGTDRYLLDQVRERMTYTETRAALVSLRAKWRQVRVILVEAKANGDALLDDLRTVLPGLLAFEPGNASKDVRAELAAVDFEAGHVYLPEPRWCPWITDYERELLEFPGGNHDDQVDATTQILLRWSETAITDPRREFGFLFRTAA